MTEQASASSATRADPSTVAIVIALARSEGGNDPAALLRVGDETLLARLASHLLASGCDEVVVVSRPEDVTACRASLDAAGISASWRTAEDLDGALSVVAEGCSPSRRIVVAQAEIVTHRGALRGLLADPRVGSGMLVASASPNDDTQPPGWPVRVVRGRVVEASSAFHDAPEWNVGFLDVLVVQPADVPELERVALSLRDAIRPSVPGDWETERERKQDAWSDADGVRIAAASVNVAALLVTGLARARVTLRCSYLRDLYWARVLSEGDADRAAEEIDRIDERRVLMDSAVKANDGFFGTFFCSPYTKYIARWAAERGIAPNQVTVLSFALGLSSAASFAQGTRGWLVAGAVLLYLTLAFDCVDGQLARYSKRFTALGAWLDPMFDRAKEYSVYAALAYGAVRHGASATETWTLAAVTMSLQTVKHFMDFSFAAGQHRKLETLPPAGLLPVIDPVEAAGRAGEGGPPRVRTVFDESSESQDTTFRARPASGGRPGWRGVASRVVSASRTLDRFGWATWVKRIIGFPIGERYAAISITAAVASPRAVFIVMIAWNLVSALYTGAGRIVRSVL